MSKKIKITEEQLKTIMERRHTYQMDTNEEEVTDMDQLDDKDQEEVDVKEPEDVNEEDSLMNESIQKIKNNFKRFL
jgi:hypothetical protein